jgi:hypothetical protein
MANAFLDAWTVSTPSSARAATAMRAVLLMGKTGLAGLPRTTGDKLALDAARSAASVGGGSDAIETIRLITGWMTEDGRSPFEAEGDFHDPELVALEQAERRQIAWSCMLLSVANEFDGGEQPWLDAMKLASFRITEALGYD